MNTAQLAELTGVTERQLQWWDENNIVSPKLAGHARAYTVDQATVVGFVQSLRKAGVNLGTARKVARSLEKFPTAGWVALTMGRRRVASFAAGPVEIANFAAEVAAPVVVVQIIRFSEADVPAAKKRKNAAQGRRGVTVAESIARRNAGMLTAEESALTRAALTAGDVRDYRTAHDVLVARDNSRVIGG